MKHVHGWAGAFALVFVAIILGELPVMKELDHFIKDYEFWWLTGAASTGIVGFVLLMGAILDLIISRGNPMNHKDVGDLSRSVKLAARPTTWRATAYHVGSNKRFRGTQWVFLRPMKDAWRSGTWPRETVWQRRFLTTVVGLFWFVFFLGPSSIKIPTGGTLLHALGRTAWDFWRA